MMDPLRTLWRGRNEGETNQENGRGGQGTQVNWVEYWSQNSCHLNVVPLLNLHHLSFNSVASHDMIHARFDERVEV